MGRPGDEPSFDGTAAKDANDASASADVTDANAEGGSTNPSDAEGGDAGRDEQAHDASPDTGNQPDVSQPPAGPLSIGITWASIANIYLELGSVSAMIDGYITRLPSTDFYGGGGGLAFTHTNYSSDEAAIGRVLTALGGPTHIDYLLTGHSHWDHSFDTPTWARLTGAPIYGPQTTCFQARAEGTPAAACTAVVGGEKLQLAPGVTMRVIRWNSPAATPRATPSSTIPSSSLPYPTRTPSAAYGPAWPKTFLTEAAAAPSFS